MMLSGDECIWIKGVNGLIIIFQEVALTVELHVNAIGKLDFPTATCAFEAYYMLPFV